MRLGPMERPFILGGGLGIGTLALVNAGLAEQKGRSKCEALLERRAWLFYSL